MADAIISQVVETVAAILKDKIRYEFNLVRGVDKELLDLSDKLKTIKKVLDDAEKKGVKDQTVKSWLRKLENTAYEMDDILDEWNYALLKHEIEASVEPKPKIGCSFILSPCLCFKKVSHRRDTAKNIENVKAKLDQIFKEKDDFGFETNSQPAIDLVREQSTSSIDLKKVHGSDIQSKKSDIISKLMLDAANTQILSIVGTGGLGKTTLAQLIFNDPLFDKDWLKIWVCVSDPFVVSMVAKNIVNSVGKETIPADNDQLELALQKLKASVLGKKFLLVLDDVWTEDNDKWEPLKINLEYGAPGSKVLVTTRNERVAKMMGTSDGDIYHPKELSLEECWSLLRDTSLAGKSEEECGEFEDVGKKIAGKCKGLPLAAVVLGRLLRFKDLEGWKHVEKSEIWELDNDEVKLFPHLLLSYNELSPALKSCFSYCAVYPKDHRIQTKTLIEEWIAQGYLGSISGNCEVELKGREYLNNLAMRSLFLDIELSESGEQVEWCKMHDIIHDFAQFLRKNDDKERSCQACDPSLVSHVQKYRSLCWNYGAPLDDKEKSCKVCDCMKSLRVLRIWSSIPVGIEMLIHLRRLDLSSSKMSKDGFKIICRLYFLQSLLLSRCNLTEIPREIKNLVQLRQLDLSWNEELKELPESMGYLVELRTLSLKKCSLEEIPREIGNLVQLRQLDLSWNRELKELPESMGYLVELRTLSLYHCSLEEIPREIGNLVQLRQLDLSWNRELKELPESMYNLIELRTLSLGGCSLEEIPPEIGNLVQLRQLDLSWNRELKELPENMYSLIELRTLSLRNCSLEEIPREIGNLVQLRQLDLSRNRELKELPENMYNLIELRTLTLANCDLKEIGGKIKNLVHLRALDLRWNERLKELPESICSLVKLQILNIPGTVVNNFPEAVDKLNCTIELSEFKVGSHYGKFGFLKKFDRHLTGSLSLAVQFSSMSDMVELVEDARQEQLKTLLQKLKTLQISFEGTMNEMEQSSSSSSSIWMEVVEALVPYYKLNKLIIIQYKGSRLPHWMSSPLNFIKEIHLNGLSEVSSLPAMGKLPFLEFLSVEMMEQSKLVGREFIGIESSPSDDDVVAFPKLGRLQFDMCSKWEEWEDITEEEEESAAISIMPCLTQLNIIECERLKKLPHRLLRKTSSSLQLLDISLSSELIKTYGEDKEGSAWRSISQHNPQLRLRK